MADAALIDGKAFAERLRARVAQETRRLEAEHGIVPGLAVVLVGSDPASQTYVRSKSRKAPEAGIRAVDRQLAATTREEELLALLAELNADPSVHGILVQLPLPGHLNASRIRAPLTPARTSTASTRSTWGCLPRGRRAAPSFPARRLAACCF